MKIETKYDIGQEVWVMKNNLPQKFKVQGVNLEFTGGLYRNCMYFGIDEIHYELGTRMSSLIYSECYLFPTKEELLKSL